MSARKRSKGKHPPPPWYRTHRGRRWAFAAVILAAYFAIPFLQVGGRPVLGFDRHHLRFYVGGVGLWMGDLFIVLLATLLLVALILLLTLWLGRVWCGWACPQTVVLDVLDQLKLLFKVRSRDTMLLRLGKRTAVHGSFLLLNLLGSAALIWYIIPPREFATALLQGTLPLWAWGTWLILFGLFYGELLWLGRRFCTRACPYAKLQGVLFDRTTLVVEYDRTREEDCIDCKKCVKVCPTEIDIRDGLQMECIACGECIDICDQIMTKVGTPTKLIQFTFGSTSEPRRRILRPSLAAMGIACVALTAALVQATVTRATVEVSVLRDRMHLLRVAKDGRLMNSYTAVIENRSQVQQSLTMWVEGIEDLELVTPSNPVTVAPEAVRKVRFVLVHRDWRGMDPGNHPLTIHLLTESEPPVEAATGTTFTVPEAEEHPPATPPPSSNNM